MSFSLHRPTHGLYKTCLYDDASKMIEAFNNLIKENPDGNGTIIEHIHYYHNGTVRVIFRKKLAEPKHSILRNGKLELTLDEIKKFKESSILNFEQ